MACWPFSFSTSSLLFTNSRTSSCRSSATPSPLLVVSLGFPLHTYSPVVKESSTSFKASTNTNSSFLPLLDQGGFNDGSSGNNNDNNNNNNNNNWFPFDFGDWLRDGFFLAPHFFFCSNHKMVSSSSTHKDKDMHLLLLLSLVGCFWHSKLALATTLDPFKEGDDKEEVVWEVRGGIWKRLIPHPSDDEFITAGSKTSSTSTSISSKLLSHGPNLWIQCKDLFLRLMLPEGYPDSVSSDYMEYSLWRSVQGVASQISGVLATQALLYAVGLGKGAIPTAAAVNWVLKDGIGYISKIFLSKYGRHFDVNPKGWRLFADLLENAAYGMEILTPAFPHLFVIIGAAAGAGRSAAALIQAATRSCFYAGFAAQRNFAEVIAKGEAQGMVSKSIGIMIGIALANCIGSSVPLAIVSFGAVTGIHMFCNLKSYQSIQLRTLNPYRASLVFSEYLISGQVPSVREVNDEEPLFPSVRLLNIRPTYKPQSELSMDAKDAAAEIENRLQLGSKLSEVINSKEDAFALFELYKDQGYMLTEYKGKFCVILKEESSSEDMLKSMFHVNYLYWLERNVGIESRNATDDCKSGGKLQISLDYVQREFNHVKNDGQLAGWVTNGIIARPLPNRIRPCYVSSPPTR